MNPHPVEAWLFRKRRVVAVSAFVLGGAFLVWGTWAANQARISAFRATDT